MGDTCLCTQRLINSFTHSNQNSLNLDKWLKYEERVSEIEDASYVPFVLSGTGGAGPYTTVTLKRLATLLEEKSQSHYIFIIRFLHCHFIFTFLRLSVMCLRVLSTASWSHWHECSQPRYSKGSAWSFVRLLFTFKRNSYPLVNVLHCPPILLQTFTGTCKYGSYTYTIIYK